MYCLASALSSLLHELFELGELLLHGGPIDPVFIRPGIDSGGQDLHIPNVRRHTSVTGCIEMKAADFQDLIGTEIGVSEWMEITQDRVDAFADATDDHQWIHVDRERAAASPFGGTIAHGFLTLSLTVALSEQVPLEVGSPLMGINYGLEKVRFPAPIPVGTRIRARVGLVSVTDVEGGIQLNRQVTIEVEGTEKPAMVAETVSRLYY